MIPRRSIVSKSFFAADSFSGARRWGREQTGGPFVVIWNLTPCEGSALENEGVVSVGQLRNRSRKGELLADTLEIWRTGGEEEKP